MSHLRFDQASYWRDRGNRYLDEFARHDAATDALFAQQEQELGAVLDEVGLSTVDSVVEVGCGFGRLTPVVPNRTSATRYVGIDVAPGQIEAARERFTHLARSEWLVGDFLKLDVPKCDLLFAGEVFLHFPPEQIASVIERAHATARIVVHVDPWLGSAQRKLPMPRLMLERLSRRAPLHATNWWHDYPVLHAQDGWAVTATPVLGGSQHVFIARSVR